MMYHRVVDGLEGSNPYNLSISLDRFEMQLRYLADRAYRGLTLEELAGKLDSGDKMPARSVVITFDDGYKDTFTHAFPILQEYGFTATVFLVSGHIGESSSWDAGKTDASPLMDRSEIFEMARHGIDFGSHSRTHTSLPALTRDEARNEVAQSKTELEQLMGRKINAFAYPFGGATPWLQDIVRDAGYSVACGIDQRRHDRFNLSRVDAAAYTGALRWRLNVTGTKHRLRQSPLIRRLKSALTAIG
ncbi:MAG: polysaccharide deacetylase family protein [Chloroflexi bacterium]|nr:polysaccharide deacetylase family protein [Chloroflexota bacterium]